MTATEPSSSPSSSPGRGISRTFIPLDSPLSWGCSGRGWNCCTDKDIPLRPYDVHRLARALDRPARALLDDGLFTLEWDGYGILGGWLATRPYEETRTACVFYGETRDAEGNLVAGLCNAHAGRPEACRGFPFQRHADWSAHPDAAADRTAMQVSDCGSCALARPTTARAVMLDNDLEAYWRADDAYRAVVQYLHKSGLANLGGSAYRRLPLPPDARFAFWAAMFTHPGSYADALTAILDATDALISASDLTPAELGGPGAPIPRPDVHALLDPARAVLP
ncbi:MAG: YkgJ family cysteine cluster protein [Dehalococcoidia bacterium]